MATFRIVKRSTYVQDDLANDFKNVYYIVALRHCNIRKFETNLKDFQALGSKDQVKCALGARVFLDLECDNHVTNLEKCYNSDLNLVYLQGKRDEAIVSFIPILSSQPLDFLDIENIQKLLTKNIDITLAVCDTSSNILYYQIASGVIKK